MEQSDLLVKFLGTDGVEAIIFEIFLIVQDVKLLRQMLDTLSNEVLILPIA
jgi:hypothetical protein